MFSALAGLLSRLDTAAFHWVIDHRWAPLSSFMIVLSHGGAWVWVAIGFALAFAFRRTGVFAGAYQSSMAIGLAILLADAVAKPSLDRARPYFTFAGIDVLAGPEKRLVPLHTCRGVVCRRLRAQPFVPGVENSDLVAGGPCGVFTRVRRRPLSAGRHRRRGGGSRRGTLCGGWNPMV